MSGPSSLDELPPALRAPLNTLLNDLIASYGSTLRSVCLYGSGATQEYVHRRSAVTLLVVLAEVGLAELHQAALHAPRWRALGVVTPLLLTPQQIRSSLDVYPLELLEMKAHHHCLYGENPLTDLVFPPAAVRQQCERELMGKLITLREGFIEHGSDAQALESLLIRAFRALRPVLRGLVWFSGRSLPSSTPELFTLVEGSFGISVEAFRTLYALKQGTSQLVPAQLEALFDQLHETLGRLAEVVDQLHPA
ncbi:MAG TPA: hypothetical protein VJO34_01005 [Methylomirabilota bacterium]|nr:hypothetical protein [Methylomirabilota bacterium]